MLFIFLGGGGLGLFCFDLMCFCFVCVGHALRHPDTSRRLPQRIMIHFAIPYPPKFNIASEKWWLEDYFPIGKIAFQGYVKLREGSFFICLIGFAMS